MEQDLTHRGGPELGMCASDQEIFQRIWKRVMPEERPDCPIAVNGGVHTPPRPRWDPASGGNTAAEGGVEQESSAPAEAFEPPIDTPEPPIDTPQPPIDTPEPPIDTPTEPPCETPKPPCAVPAHEPPESRTHGGDDFPGPDAVPCLGSGSAAHAGQLQEDILCALEGWQLYRHLARKVGGNAARTLSALASEKHRQGRRLAAAYFLISGVRFWPTDRLETPRFGSWLGTLRRRFALEQQLDSRWRAASLDTDDPCLAVLYGELAEECAAHAGVLRTLLENAL